MRLKNFILVLGLAWLVSQCHLPTGAADLVAPLGYCDQRLVSSLQSKQEHLDTCKKGDVDSLANPVVW